MFSLFSPPTARPALEDFALYAPDQLSRWSPRQTNQLHTRCRGRLFEGWADKVATQWGAEALEALQQQLQEEGETLSPTIQRDRWYDLGRFLRLVELVADEHLDGDLEAYRALVMQTFHHSQSRRARMLRRLLRAVQPGMLLRKLTSLYTQLHDRGSMRLLMHKGAATLQFEGAAHHDHPTWQALMIVALECMFEMMRRPDTRIATQQPSPGCFHLYVAWR